MGFLIHYTVFNKLNEIFPLTIIKDTPKESFIHRHITLKKKKPFEMKFFKLQEKNACL